MSGRVCVAERSPDSGKPGFMSSGRRAIVAGSYMGWATGPGHGLVPFLSPDFQKWTNPHQALCQPPRSSQGWPSLKVTSWQGPQGALREVVQ